MIIHDLSYLETISENGVVGGYGTVVKKKINAQVNVDLNTDVDIDIDKDFDADADLDAQVNIDGNLATLTFDVEAIGNNTLAEADVAVIATDSLSSVSGTLIAGVDP